MPERRSYRVTKTQEMNVTATSPGDAIAVANAHFKGLDNPTLLGEVTSTTRDVDMTAYEVS